MIITDENWLVILILSLAFYFVKNRFINDLSYCLLFFLSFVIIIIYFAFFVWSDLTIHEKNREFALRQIESGKSKLRWYRANVCVLRRFFLFFII
mgnify:CR=1 FL=1